MGYAAYEHQFEGFEIKVKQKLPDMNWSMIPSPELQLETKLIEKQNVSDKLELKYDCQSRVGEQTFLKSLRKRCFQLRWKRN